MGTVGHKKKKPPEGRLRSWEIGLAVESGGRCGELPAEGVARYRMARAARRGRLPPPSQSKIRYIDHLW